MKNETKGVEMKVLLVNGSPHREGCTHLALSEVASALEKNGFESEIFHIGTKPVQGCIGCYKCKEENASGCVFKDKLYIDFVAKIQECDAIVIGSPVYYAGPPGSLCSILDRVFFSAGKFLKGKCAAAIVNCRRGGASAAFDRLNKYFTINQMPVVSSQYWNSTHGMNPDETRQDLEGLQTMRTLGNNMAYLMKSISESKVTPPTQEERISTNFI